MLVYSRTLIKQVERILSPGFFKIQLIQSNLRCETMRFSDSSFISFSSSCQHAKVKTTSQTQTTFIQNLRQHWSSNRANRFYEARFRTELYKTQFL